VSKLTAAARRRLPASAFAGKGRSYPVEDKGHAKAAIARAEQYSPSDKADIIARARRVLGKGKGKKSK
jgi:hypothetical protein